MQMHTLLQQPRRCPRSPHRRDALDLQITPAPTLTFQACSSSGSFPSSPDGTKPPRSAGTCRTTSCTPGCWSPKAAHKDRRHRSSLPPPSSLSWPYLRVKIVVVTTCNAPTPRRLKCWATRGAAILLGVRQGEQARVVVEVLPTTGGGQMYRPVLLACLAACAYRGCAERRRARTAKSSRGRRARRRPIIMQYLRRHAKATVSVHH